MPRASKRKINKNILEEIEDNFAFLISSLTTSKDIQHFFETFLTKEEKTMLTKRLMLHLMIQMGYEPQDIATVLSLSRDTVYKHTLLLEHGDEVYKSVIGKIAARRKTKEFWKEVEKVLRPIGLMLQVGTDMKARAKLMTGDYD